MPINVQERSLAYQIITFIFIFLLVIFAISIFTTRILFRQVILDNSRELVTHLAHETINQIAGKLENMQILTRSVQEIAALRLLPEDELNTLIYNLISDNHDLVGVCIAQKDAASGAFRARVIYDEHNNEVVKHLAGADFTYQDWFQIPYLTEKGYWSEPWYDINGPKMLIVSYCVPMFEKGKVVGILRLDTELRSLQSIVSPLKIKKRGYSFLISNVGTIITHPADSLVMNESIFSLAESYHDKQLRDLGRAMIAGEIGFQRIRGNSPMRDSWVFFSPIHINQWSLGILIDHADVMKDENLIIIIQTIISILTFLIISVIVYYRTLSVSKPLRKFTDVAERIGKGDFDTTLPAGSGTYEIDRLTDSFAAMQSSLKEYITNLQITNQEKNKIVSEVRVASEIQRNLIPSNTEHPYNINDLRVFGILEPAGDIGGDLYDYFMIDDNHFCFAIADVAGKGIVAAMTMTITSTFLRGIGNYHVKSSEMLYELNRFLYHNNVEANFVTILLGVIDLRTGRLQFSNAGHLPLFLRKLDGTVHKFSITHATAIGVFENIQIGHEELMLAPGDELLMFTDGITEAMNTQEHFLGLDGLEGVIKNLGVPNPQSDANAILACVRSFSRNMVQRDDTTILIIDYRHPSRK